MIIHAPFQQADPALIAAADCLITDPPYSADVHSKATSTGSNGAGPSARDLGFEHITPETRRQICAVAGGVPRWTIVFSDLESTHLWRADMSAANVEYVREVAHAPGPSNDADPLPARWIRWSQPQITGDRPVQGCEAVLTFHGMRKGKPIAKRWNGPGGLMAFQQRALRGHDKHGAEKPLDLMLAIVCYFSDPNELVVDLCAGSGTTALACRILGRDCIGYERDERWAKWADVRERSPLCARDLARALEWVNTERADIERAGYTEGDGAKYLRAMRRLADVNRVADAAKAMRAT